MTGGCTYTCGKKGDDDIVSSHEVMNMTSTLEDVSGRCLASCNLTFETSGTWHCVRGWCCFCPNPLLQWNVSQDAVNCRCKETDFRCRWIIWKATVSPKTPPQTNPTDLSQHCLYRILSSSGCSRSALSAVVLATWFSKSCSKKKSLQTVCFV